MAADKPLLSPSQVAEYLGVSRQHIYTLMDRGLPSIKFGRCRRFRLADVDDWLASEAAEAVAS